MTTSKWFSGSGDDGMTDLFGDGRVPKYHPQPEALGTLDEATAILGFVRSISRHPDVRSVIVSIQKDLIQMMTELAATPGNKIRYRPIDGKHVSDLEKVMDEFGSRIEVSREFIIPGDTPAGAALDMARTVIRRAERTICRLVHDGICTNPYILRYANRLSSLCFILARFEDSGGVMESAVDPSGITDREQIRKDT